LNYGSKWEVKWKLVYIFFECSSRKLCLQGANEKQLVNINFIIENSQIKNLALASFFILYLASLAFLILADNLDLVLEAVFFFIVSIFAALSIAL